MTATSALRLCLLAAWIAMLLTWSLILVPSAFATVPGTDLIGALVGRSLDRVDQAGVVVGVGIFALSLLEVRGRTTVTAGTRRVSRGSGWLRSSLPLAAVLLHGFSLGWISPEIRALRDAAGGSLGNLGAESTEMVRFGRLHTLSLAGFTLGGLIVIGALMWDLTRIVRAREWVVESVETPRDS